jgi:hypothetical protein
MMMHGLTNPKFISANQAGVIHAYRNVKRKLHKTMAAIWFNKTCRDKELRPNYINIKINGNNRQCNNTMKAAVRFRINQEIKFLYIKKQKLNETTGPTTTNDTATTTFQR